MASNASNEDRGLRRAALSARNAPLIPPPSPPVEAAPAESGDEDEDSDQGRIVISGLNGPLSRELGWDVRRAIEAELTSLLRNRAEGPIYINEWHQRRGGWVVTPGGDDPQQNGNRFLRVVNEMARVQGQHFRGDWNHDLARHATLTVRFSSYGNPQDLLEDPDIGAVRMNNWPRELQGQIRYLSVRSEEGSNYRLARFEASEEVVRRIQDNRGQMRIGFEMSTVRSGKKDVKENSPVVFKLQK